jgi:hypothetical protein
LRDRLDGVRRLATERDGGPPLFCLSIADAIRAMAVVCVAFAPVSYLVRSVVFHLTRDLAVGLPVSRAVACLLWRHDRARLLVGLEAFSVAAILFGWLVLKRAWH